MKKCKHHILRLNLILIEVMLLMLLIGLLVRKDNPLAKQEQILYKDIADKSLIVSKEINGDTQLIGWFKNNIEHLNIISTYTLLYNAILVVVGYVVCLDKLANTSSDNYILDL